ncbi:hypothetical protein OYT93_04920 [Leuconostoc pseudomesenteroides]|nr:hypothetical protein [Leuconostoc pseudomesenteroides]WAM39565.1 hypothetical protein OYT93_04920 [Leuconostoc pseudomesenteroides]
MLSLLAFVVLLIEKIRRKK